MTHGLFYRALRSTKTQLEFTLAAMLVVAWFLLVYGLPPEQRLFDYAKQGDASGVRRALGWGADPNGGDPTLHGATPLEIAIFCNPANQVQFDDCGPFTAGAAKTIAALLDHGAAVDARDGEGRTLLHRVLKDESMPQLTPNSLAFQKEVAEILIAHGAAVDAQDHDGETVLYCAAWAYWGGHLDVARSLVARGAAVNVRPMDGRSLLHLAAEEGDTELAAMLLARGLAVDGRDDGGRTPLAKAARGGHREVAALLIAKGADVAARDTTGEEPLGWAAEEGRAEVAELLLAHGAKVNAATDSGCTPLHWAAGQGQAEMVELLLARGANIGVKTSQGETPLKAAREALARALKDQRAPLDAVVKLLQQHGATE